MPAAATTGVDIAGAEMAKWDIRLNKNPKPIIAYVRILRDLEPPHLPGLLRNAVNIHGIHSFMWSRVLYSTYYILSAVPLYRDNG